MSAAFEAQQCVQALLQMLSAPSQFQRARLEVAARRPHMSAAPQLVCCCCLLFCVFSLFNPAHAQLMLSTSVRVPACSHGA